MGTSWATNELVVSLFATCLLEVLTSQASYRFVVELSGICRLLSVNSVEASTIFKKLITPLN